LLNDENFIINCIISNNKIIQFFPNNNLYLLIHNLQHNFNIDDIILNELFLNNIDYISKISHFDDILSFILKYHFQIFIENYKKFIHHIVNNLEYIQLCQEHNIHIFNIDEVTNFNEYNFEDIKKEYEMIYSNKIILWYR
jgi:hypothetical protein